jgi:hypothetical protein
VNINLCKLNSFVTQQIFDNSLSKRIEKMEERLLNILIRLEDRLDSSAERTKCERVQKATEAVHKHSMEPILGGGGGLGGKSDLGGIKRCKSRQGAWQHEEPAQISVTDLDSTHTQSAPGKRNPGQENFKKLATSSCSMKADRACELMQSGCGKEAVAFPSGANSAKQLLQSEMPVDVFSELKSFSTQLGSLVKKVELIAVSMGVHGVSSEFDYEEDRKRLKEKLKQAIDVDIRSRIRPIVSRAEVWLEYIFGICKPDQRLGKRGSRYSAVLC